MFGFLREVKKAADKFPEEDTYVFTWDGDRSKSLRKQIFPEYKENRKETPLTKEDFEQFDILRNVILPSIGFKNIVVKQGYEADDIIANYCFRYPRDKKIIVSADNDLYQLLKPNNSTIMLFKDKVFDWKKFEKKYGFAPELWNAVKKITGCKGDNVPGIPGMGIKNATKIVKGGEWNKLNDKTNIILRNHKLIVLPFNFFKVNVPQTDNNLSLKEFKLICHKYNFYSFLKNTKQWKQSFNMK